ELKRKKEGIAGERCRGGQRQEPSAEDAEGRTEKESERLAGDRDLRPCVVHPHRAVKRKQERGRRKYRRAGAVEPDGNAGPGDGDLAGGRDRVGEERGRECEGRDHRRPLMETARAASRSATLRFKSCRLSCCFLPRPRAIATLARPFLK